MTRQDSLRINHVESFPDVLGPGILYVSRRYSTASHLCCCGCGIEVVTPLNPAKWSLKEVGDRPSLSPSIGNHGFPCRSHYWIQNGAVRWDGAMSAAAVAKVRARDRADAEAWAYASLGRAAKTRARIRSMWDAALSFVRRLWP